MNKLYAISNDGIVSIDSGQLLGKTLAKVEMLNGYDHVQMKDDRNLAPILFTKLAGDLQESYSSETAILSAAEYFIDTDPGEGMGTVISPKDGLFDTTTEDLELSYDTSSLTTGVHNLYIRMKNSDGLWGTPRKILFDVSGNKNISAAEYYIDTDPGEGQGSQLVAMDGAFDQVAEDATANIDTTAMATGLHTMYVRAKNSEGHWGTPRVHKFEVLQPPTMAAAEYFVDTDPGAGNGTAMNAEDGIFNSTAEALLKTLNTSSLGIGNHTLYVRGKDSYQRWGAFQSTTFLNGYLLNVAGTGTGTGTVSSGDTPQGINCGSDCTGIYNGQSVTLTAVADPGSTFISWSGCTTASGNNCTVLVSADKSVTALFNDITPPDTTISDKPPTITATSTASFSFSSTEANSAFECRIDGGAFATCTSPVVYSALVIGSHTFEVRASDANGNWDATPASYTWERGAQLTVGFDGIGNGSVTSAPPGISCTSGCSALYSKGNLLSLMATPDIYSYFAGWSGACPNISGNCPLTMDSDKNVTVTFSTMSPLRIIGTATDYYQSLLAAYAAAQDGTAVTIDARAVELSDVDFNLNRGISVTLKGGYDGSYNDIAGFTTLNGILTVTRGSLMVDRLIVK